jgi:hypothetical protein
MTDGPNEPQEDVMCRLRRKRRREDETNDRPNDGVAPIGPTETTGSFNEVVELRVQDSHLRFRERVRAPPALRQFLESRRNLFLLVRSERCVLDNLIGFGSEQPSLSLKFGPKIRRFEVALNDITP